MLPENRFRRTFEIYKDGKWNKNTILSKHATHHFQRDLTRWRCFKLSMLESPQLWCASWSNTSFFCLALPCKTHWALEDSIGSCEVAPISMARHLEWKWLPWAGGNLEFIHIWLKGWFPSDKLKPYVTRVWMCHLLERKYTETCANKPKSFLVPFSFEIVCQVLDVNLFRVPWNTKGRQKAENRYVLDSLLIIICKHCAVLIGWEAELGTPLQFHRWDWVAGAFSVIFGEESVRTTFPKDISYIELGADSFVSYKKWSHDN